MAKLDFKRFHRVTFEVTEDHLKLLRNMWVNWQDCEYGAPEIDPKRPYGNSSVEYDIAEILGIPIPGEDENYEPRPFPPEALARIQRLHRETGTALQIALRVGKFEAGLYESQEYIQNWQKVEGSGG